MNGIENTNKKWYKLGHGSRKRATTEQNIKTVKYVPASDLAQEFFAPIKMKLL